MKHVSKSLIVKMLIVLIKAISNRERNNVKIEDLYTVDTRTARWQYLDWGFDK